MSVALAVALLALLVALFALVALVAVYAKVRALEAVRAAELSGYGALVGRPGPESLRPRAGERRTVVAVLDADCALCHGVWDALADGEPDPAIRFVALVDRTAGFAPKKGGRAELVTDASARADLFEGYSPTVLVLDGAGTVTHRTFVYADTDLRGLVQQLSLRHRAEGQEVTRA